MPGFVTHYLFGVQAYKQIHHKDIKDTIRKHNHAFSLGLQGPDIFFYFLLTSTPIMPNISGIMHKRKTGEFFRQLISSVNSIQHYEDFEIAAAYIQGFMGHYLLDTRMHPYVYGRVGTSVSRKTLGIHFGLESDIDREVLFHYKKKKPADFPHRKVMNVTPHEEAVIAAVLHEAIYKTYNLDVTPRLIQAAIISFKAESALLHDPHLHKHTMIHAIEKRVWGYPVVSALLVNDYAHMEDPCNLRHERWCNPWDQNYNGTESVYSIMERTEHTYLQCMPAMWDALEDAFHFVPKKHPYILDLLGNLSYTSGLDCTIPLHRDR